MAKKICKKVEKERLFRVIDANINRLREALRVIEEIARFILDDKSKSLKLKNIRHGLEGILSSMKLDMALIELSRESEKDVGKALNIPAEMRKSDCRSILMSNLHRAEESLRVLEEFMKLFDEKASGGFKKLRFDVYSIEKAFIE